MVVTHNDIINAIAKAQGVALMYSRTRVLTLKQGGTPSAEQNAAIIEIRAWIKLLQIAESQWEEGCITEDDTWQVIQSVNKLAREVPCSVNKTYSRNSSAGGGNPAATGYVEAVLGLLVNNSNSRRPVINLYVDGTTITGDGTQGNPLVANGTSAPIYPDTQVVFGDGVTAGGTTSSNFSYNEATEDFFVRFNGGDDSIELSGNGAYNTHFFRTVVGDASNFTQWNNRFEFYSGSFTIGDLSGNGSGIVGVDNDGLLSFFNTSSIAAITNITASALNTLRLASNISTTTFYNVTNAVGNTLVLQVYAIANNTNTPYAINVATGDIGYYNITDDEFFSVLPVVPNGVATVKNITKASFIGLFPGFEVDPKACYRITDAAQGVVRIFGATTGTSTAAAFLEGSWDGSVLTNGAWGNYNVSTDTFTAIGVIWGSITGNILDQTDVGARKDAQRNVFIGSDNAANTIGVDSTDNLFSIFADSNTLAATTRTSFGINAQGNELDSSQSCAIGDGCSENELIGVEFSVINKGTINCELENVSEVIIGEFCNRIKIKNTTVCVFQEKVSEFDNTVYIGDAFTLCTIKSNQDFTDVDFTNAAQLFGRANAWSINKVLGTDLIEVTFDANLATAQTGQYDTSTDTFSPYGGTWTPTLTPDGSVCTAAALATDAIYSVSNGAMTIMIPITGAFDFTAGNDAAIDYTLPFGAATSSGGSISIDLSGSAPILPISGYEKNGGILVTCNDNTFNNNLTIYATITIKLV